MPARHCCPNWPTEAAYGAMSEAMADCGISWHTHDPGVVLTHLAVAIADGADCLTDFEALGEQSKLHGDVASVSTAWRAVKKTTAPELRGIAKAVAENARPSGPRRRPVTSPSMSTPRS